jgi:hypothetical protein
MIDNQTIKNPDSQCDEPKRIRKTRVTKTAVRKVQLRSTMYNFVLKYHEKVDLALLQVLKENPQKGIELYLRYLQFVLPTYHAVDYNVNATFQPILNIIPQTQQFIPQRSIEDAQIIEELAIRTEQIRTEQPDSFANAVRNATIPMFDLQKEAAKTQIEADFCTKSNET